MHDRSAEHGLSTMPQPDFVPSPTFNLPSPTLNLIRSPSYGLDSVGLNHEDDHVIGLSAHGVLMKTRGNGEADLVVHPDKGGCGGSAKTRRTARKKARRRQELESYRRLVGPLRDLGQQTGTYGTGINGTFQRHPSLSYSNIGAGHHERYLVRSQSSPPQLRRDEAFDSAWPEFSENRVNYHDSPPSIGQSCFDSSHHLFHHGLPDSSPQTILVDSAANPSDECQNCSVNIAEIERTSSFQFPFSCPVCKHPRSPLSLTPSQQQSAASSGVQTSISHPAEQDHCMSCIAAADSAASPKWRPYRNHLTPTQRGVRPSQRYRPIYSDYGRSPSRQLEADVSGRWLHDRYEEPVGKEQGFRRQGSERESRGNRSDENKAPARDLDFARACEQNVEPFPAEKKIPAYGVR